MEKEHEIYKDYYYLSNVSNYLINKKGDIFSLILKKCINTYLDKETQQLKVFLKEKDRSITPYVARLVAETFIPKPDNLKNKKLIVRYHDNNKLNTSVKNLFWTTTSQYQQSKWDAIYKQNDNKYPLPLFDNNNNGLYPNAIECKSKPGYFYIPVIKTHVVINKNGDVFNLITNKTHPINFNKKGYLITSLGKSKEYVNYQIHRLVALLFVGKTKEHFDKEYSSLQVNHIDCIKTNNNFKNLEWVTNQENIDHAWENDLIKTNIKVLSKNILTNEIKQYRSISKCSLENLIECNNLIRYLNSDKAGRCTKGWFVFKYDDGKPWPILKEYEINKDTWNSFNDVKITNVVTGVVILALNMRHACELANINFNGFKSYRQRNGVLAPYKNWIIEPF